MTARRAWKSYLLAALVGTLIILLVVPFLRMALLDLSFWRTGRALDKRVPGPALVSLIRIEPWSAYDANYQQKLRAEKLCCYVRLGDLAEAFRIAQQMNGGATPPDYEAQDVWEKILRVPYEGVGKVLAKWPRHSAAAELDGYAVLREELELGNHAEALGTLDRLLTAAAGASIGSGENATSEAARQIEDALAALSVTTVTEVQPPDPAMVRHEPVRPAPTGPSTERWAITISPENRVYDNGGKFLKRVNAGMLLKISDETASGEVGRLFKCTSYPSGTTPFLVRAGDVEFYEGNIALLDPAVVDLLVNRARLDGRIQGRESELRETAKTRNPYYADYEKARTAYRNFAIKVKALTKVRDEATGAKRVDAAMELNNMMGKGSSLDREFRTMKNKYEGWNATQSDAVETDRDPQIIRLRRELETVEAKLQEIMSRNG